MPNANIPELPLREIHLPDPISWWPIAYGWWLAALFFIIFTGSTIFLLKKWFKPNLRKEALKELKKIEAAFNESEDPHECLKELSEFLRRVSMTLEQKTAGLIGASWLQWLDKSLENPEFSEGIGKLLLTGPYQKTVNDENLSELFHLCRKWVKCI